MGKTVTLSSSLESKITPIRIYNNTTFFSIKIHKKWLFKWIRYVAVALLLVAYGSTIFISYQSNSEQFWTLLKVGMILIFISIIALIQKQ
ncbi:DUF6095 family protein [Kordia zhangzhouensis]|uniref:DUF6095 family protein n=1 Tax=Kordia zhangzhouensis TaxID=1620405 RepID=UPI0006292E1E|nr:DUF6095 family protein [Kordia zhangzhouensis]